MFSIQIQPGTIVIYLPKPGKIGVIQEKSWGGENDFLVDFVGEEKTIQCNSEKLIPLIHIDNPEDLNLPTKEIIKKYSDRIIIVLINLFWQQYSTLNALAEFRKYLGGSL